MKVLSAYYVCLYYLNALRYVFNFEANTLKPDQNFGLIWVHIICNIGYQRLKQMREQTLVIMNGRKQVKFILKEATKFEEKNLLQIIVSYLQYLIFLFLGFFCVYMFLL